VFSNYFISQQKQQQQEQQHPPSTSPTCQTDTHSLYKQKKKATTVFFDFIPLIMEDPILFHQDEDADMTSTRYNNGPMGTTTMASTTAVVRGVATPESRPETDQERAERAAAAAEVAVMESVTNGGTTNATGGRSASRNPISDQAIMGAVGGEDGVDAHQVWDENGELVRQAFVEFLQNLYVIDLCQAK
jgi:hypothetical protein